MAVLGSYNTNTITVKSTRGLVFTWQRINVSIEGNYSEVEGILKASSHSGFMNGQNFRQVINGEEFKSARNRELWPNVEILRFTKRIYHDNAGKGSFTAYTGAELYYYGKENVTGGSTFYLDDIPRQAKITSSSNFTDEQNPTIGYSNPAGNAVSALDIAIYLTDGSTVIAPYRSASKTGSSYTFNLTESERTVLRKSLKTVNSKAVRIYLRTLIGGTSFYSTVERTASVVSATPIMNGVKYQDTNPITTALTGNNQKIIKGKSNVRLYDFSISVFKESDPKSYIIDEVSSVYTSTFEKTLTGFSKNNIPIKGVDSRGNTSSTYTKQFSSFVDYFNLVKEEATADRSDSGVGEGVILSLKGKWWNGNFGVTNNELSATYRYKKNGGSWMNGITTLILEKSGNTFSIEQPLRGDITNGFDIQSSYSIEVIIKDKLSSVVFLVELMPGAPAFAIYKNKVSLGGPFDMNREGQEIQLNKSAYDKFGKELLGIEVVSSSEGAYVMLPGGYVLCYGSLGNRAFSIPINGKNYLKISLPYQYKEMLHADATCNPVDQKGAYLAHSKSTQVLPTKDSFFFYINNLSGEDITELRGLTYFAIGK